MGSSFVRLSIFLRLGSHEMRSREQKLEDHSHERMMECFQHVIYRVPTLCRQARPFQNPRPEPSPPPFSPPTLLALNTP